MESIQEYLLSIGFSLNEKEETFSKWMNGWTRVELPFAYLAKRSLASMQNEAKDKGWIDEKSKKQTERQAEAIFL